MKLASSEDEEGDRARDLVGLAGTFEVDPALDQLVIDRIAELRPCAPVERGVDDPGTDQIDPDALRRKLGRGR